MARNEKQHVNFTAPTGLIQSFTVRGLNKDEIAKKGHERGLLANNGQD